MQVDHVTSVMKKFNLLFAPIQFTLQIRPKFVNKDIYVIFGGNSQLLNLTKNISLFEHIETIVFKSHLNMTYVSFNCKKMSFINLFTIYETPKVRPVRYGTRTKK